MPAYSKGNVPPVIPAKPKTFMERRQGPRDRRVADRRVTVDRRVSVVSDRRISISADKQLPADALVLPTNAQPAHARPPQGTGETVQPSQATGGMAPAPDKVSTPRRSGPVVIDAVDVDKSRRVYRVKPEVFVDIVDRLNLSMVIHYQKRQGMNIYFIQFEGGVVETQTPNRLSMLDVTEQDMEKPFIADTRKQAARPAAAAVAAKPPVERGPTKGTQDRPNQKEKVMASKKKQPLMEYHTEEGYYVTEWWNSPDDPALSVARIRIEPGAPTSSYELHGITERYLFLTGHGIVEIDERQYEVGPGDGLLVKAGARRRVTNRGDRDLGFLAICRPRFSRLSEEPMQNKFVKQA
jgi:mannose-6-phosphate isomerase-like protein (cupin superfamily)